MRAAHGGGSVRGAAGPGAYGRQEQHEDANGNFTYQAVGRALGNRRFDWRGVAVQYNESGEADGERTVQHAFGDVHIGQGRKPILGIFVHTGSHNTAMIRREGRIYHLDSIQAGRDYRVVEILDDDLFLQHAHCR